MQHHITVTAIRNEKLDVHVYVLALIELARHLQQLETEDEGPDSQESNR